MESTLYFQKLIEWLQNPQPPKEHIPFLLDVRYESNIQTVDDPTSEIKRIITEIVQEFDVASHANSMGDSYKFYFHFTSVLFKGIQLHILVDGTFEDWQSPKNPIKRIRSEIDKKFLEGMFPLVNQEDSNIIKRNFLDWFEELIEQIEEQYSPKVMPVNRSDLMGILTQIYFRDFLYNFRQSKMTKNIFRSPDPARFFDQDNLLERFLKENHITQIIDLRGEKEAMRTPKKAYLKYLQDHQIAHIIVNFNEPGGAKIPEDDVASKAQNVDGYVKKLIFLKESIKATFEAIASTPGAALFHCASGKDRTGVMAALIQKFLGIPDEIVINDYTRSGHDSRHDRIQNVLNYLNHYGGIQKFIDDCGISAEIQEKIKGKLKL